MILVVIEHTGSALKPSAGELLAFAGRLGQDFGLPTTAVVLGSGTSKVVEELQTRKVDRILVVDDPALASPRENDHGVDEEQALSALCDLIKRGFGET